jgi:hypothetical protein
MRSNQSVGSPAFGLVWHLARGALAEATKLTSKTRTNDDASSHSISGDGIRYVSKSFQVNLGNVLNIKCYFRRHASNGGNTLSRTDPAEMSAIRGSCCEAIKYANRSAGVKMLFDQKGICHWRLSLKQANIP